MKKIQFLLCTLLCAVTINAQQVDEVTLVAFGDGPTKQEAINVALRSAIEQTFGAFVSANTDILNDELVKDEIVTVTSGNVKSYKELSSSKLDNGSFSVSLQATVSARQLTAYAQGHGAKTEFAGAMFGQNQKLWDLNTKNEKAAIEHLIAKLEPLVSGLVNYELQVEEPRAHERNPDLVDLNCTVVAKRTETFDAFDNEILATLEALKLSEEQIQQGKQLGKKSYALNYGPNTIYYVPEIFNWGIKEIIFWDRYPHYGKLFYLRSEEGRRLFYEFLQDICFYLGEFQLLYNTSEESGYWFDYKQEFVDPQRSLKDTLPAYKLSMTYPVDEVNKITGIEVKRWDYGELFKNYRIPFPTDLHGDKSCWEQPIWGRNEFDDLVAHLKSLGAKPLKLNYEDGDYEYGDLLDENYRFLRPVIQKEEAQKVAVIPMRHASGRDWCIVYFKDNTIGYSETIFGSANFPKFACGSNYLEYKYRVALVWNRMPSESESDFVTWCNKMHFSNLSFVWSHRRYCNSYYLSSLGEREYFSFYGIKYYVVELNYY